MWRVRSIFAGLAGVLLATRVVVGFPLVWDPYLRYLNVQVTDVDVPAGATYWRVAQGDAVAPPDGGYGDVKIWFQSMDENGNYIYGIPIRIFRTSDGSTLANRQTAGEFVMGGGNWLDFYNEPGPYSLEVNTGQPSEACMGLGLPANQHFSYTIVFQRAIKGVTPTGPQPTPLGQPPGDNLLVNPGAETGDLTGWSDSGISLDGDTFNNCGNRAGIHRFSWQTFGPGTAWMSQPVSVLPGELYTFGFWVCKKAVSEYATLTATWSDNGGGSGTLYTMPGDEMIFPIYGTRQDATITPLGNQVTVRLDMAYTGPSYATFHLDEFWFVEAAEPGTPQIGLSPETLAPESYAHQAPSDDTFTVQNVGPGVLQYTITDDAEWLSVAPASGVSISEADTITVTYNIADLEAGPHSATITVSDPDAGNSPRTIDVTLTVKVPGDADADGDVDQEDFGPFQLCLTGAGGTQSDPACWWAKMDGDSDVDADDVILFQACMSGAGVAGSANCTSAP